MPPESHEGPYDRGRKIMTNSRHQRVPKRWVKDSPASHCQQEARARMHTEDKSVPRDTGVRIGLPALLVQVSVPSTLRQVPVDRVCGGT